MGLLDQAILNAFKILKPKGVLVANAMHLTQILKMLNKLNEHKIKYEIDIVIEPENRLWEIRKIMARSKQTVFDKADSEPIEEKKANKIVEEEDDGRFNWVCRLEDKQTEKVKRGGLLYNYWSGFLIKIRKI